METLCAGTDGKKEETYEAWIARMTEDNIDQSDRKSSRRDSENSRKSGGILTETVYGLGGNALDAKASEKIYAARPSVQTTR